MKPEVSELCLVCQYVLCGIRGNLPRYSLPGGIVTLYYRLLLRTIPGTHLHITVSNIDILDTGVFPDIPVAVSIRTDHTDQTRDTSAPKDLDHELWESIICPRCAKFRSFKVSVVLSDPRTTSKHDTLKREDS